MKNKKNFTILGLGLLNLILSFWSISKLATNVPINIFASNAVDKMCSKQLLLIFPVIVLVISVFQVLYRLKTMNKVVTTGKIIEDAIFAFVDGLLIVMNWALIYVGISYTSTNLIKSGLIPPIYIVTTLIGILLIALYSTFPINKKGSAFGLRTKETLADEEIWRSANRFNGFTGFISSIFIIAMSIYFVLNGFDWIYLLIGLIVCGFLMLYIPRLYAQMAYKRKAQRIIE